ncbi:AAA family ATPase [Hazenella sp. IB182357]|uniref:AAA family ATPase n=1 Tax=Polycladospora coralii TaxID=2771432 RepID=A0A926RUU8_9BACL|nr:AAA domain-containing protein [Polycladospora coralii]MBD1372824.1 AAA family ATPase [Polycladospora coralii]
MNEKPRRLFEYLRAVNNLRFQVIRDVKEYENTFSKEVLECLGEGVYLMGEGDDAEAILEIHRPHILQNVQSPPEPDDAIKEWISYPYQKETDELKQPSPKVFVQGTDEVKVSFDEDRQRLEKFHNWKLEWEQWASELRMQNQVKKLYDTFSKLHHRIYVAGEGVELFLGRTMLVWQREADSIYHPLFIAKLDIELDMERGVIKVKPINRGYQLQLSILSGIQLPQIEEIEKIDRLARYRDVLHEDITDLASHFLHVMGADVISKDGPAISEKGPVGDLDDYVLLVRKKDHHIYQQDLEQIISYLEEQNPVPAPIDAIVGNEVKVDDSHALKWDKIASDLYFPLPANEEQKEIVRRLAVNHGVSVQGPPGTGKTHTIANIVSHLLAHGKKVLITSQKENALRVLKEKIPAEIRDLCVSVLGGGKDALRDIEKSVKTISEKLGNVSPEFYEAELKRAQSQLLMSRKREANYQNQLMFYCKREQSVIDFKGQTITKADVAETLRTQMLDFKWIKDHVPLHSNFPISELEFKELWQLRGILSIEDLKLRDLVLPHKKQFKHPTEMKRWLAKGKVLKRGYERAIHEVEKVKFPHDKHFTQQVHDDLERIIKYRDHFKKDSPHFHILDDYLAHGPRRTRWTSFFADIKKRCADLLVLHKNTIHDQITLPNKEVFELEADVNRYYDHLRKHKKVSMWFGMMQGKESKYLWTTPVLNGKPIFTLEEIEKIMSFLEFRQKRKELVQTWNAHMQEIKGACVQLEDKGLVRNINQELETYDRTLRLGIFIEKLKQRCEPLCIGDNEWLEYETYIDLQTTVEQMFTVLSYEQWEKEYGSYVCELKSLRDEERMHPIVNTFLQAILGSDSVKWEEVTHQLQHITSKKQAVVRFDKLYAPLQKVASLTGAYIIDLFGKEHDIPQEPRKSWYLKSLYDWMTEDIDFDALRLERNIKQEQVNQRRSITEIVAYATWLNQMKNITEEEKRALVAWKNFIKRFGRGTGNNRRYLKDIRQEMEKAQSAIPVWIMPVKQVIENFPIHSKKFDVIIFDESSQCDLMSIPLLLRGEKLIVVGDDEQISPYGIGTKDADVEALIEHYLEGVPNKRLFDHKASLYEIADQIFPKDGRLTLKEHFRCVPEIIHFSNQLSYDGQMIPLRVPFASEKIDPPVLTVKVEHGYVTEGTHFVNEPEIEQIVQDMKQLIADPRYKNQTIGVITLQGTKQATLIEQKIREQLSESEIIHRRIVCGNAYHLQGDERDIIFLSMVVANNRRFNALTQKAYQQTFNVAASRAKNQMRLYHSVDLDDLKQEDYRYQLLSYCMKPHQTTRIIDQLEDQCESPFEIEVFRMIQANGYQVYPQVRVGRHQIDLVIEGSRERLAVECDTEKWQNQKKWKQDMQRQYDLERVGWHFWRIRGREFYLNREEAMSSLWLKLEELGIERK